MCPEHCQQLLGFQNEQCYKTNCFLGDNTMKSFFWAFTLCLTLSAQTHADLLITGVIAGGSPRSVELVATSDIADLSDFFILRDRDGTPGGPFTVDRPFQLPAVSLSRGDFFYVYGVPDAETFLRAEGFGSDATDSVLDGVVNQNGNDILALSTSNSAEDVFDAFGLLGQGTSFAENSIAYRQAGDSANPTGVLDAGNFDIIRFTDEAVRNNFGTFQVTTIPEPCSAVLIGLGTLGLGLRRRRLERCLRR